MAVPSRALHACTAAVMRALGVLPRPGLATLVDRPNVAMGRMSWPKATVRPGRMATLRRSRGTVRLGRGAHSAQ
jgi:hypothetical protein